MPLIFILFNSVNDRSLLYSYVILEVGIWYTKLIKSMFIDNLVFPYSDLIVNIFFFFKTSLRLAGIKY